MIGCPINLLNKYAHKAPIAVSIEVNIVAVNGLYKAPAKMF
jgi:hypothetical protein